MRLPVDVCQNAEKDRGVMGFTRVSGIISRNAHHPVRTLPRLIGQPSVS
jgi:hypothetical protein